jgi:hypothetical protein
VPELIRCRWRSVRRAIGYQTPDETLLAARRSHFPGPRSRPETKVRYQKPLIQQRSSIMWDIIIGLFYHQACKRYLAAARRQRTLWA